MAKTQKQKTLSIISNFDGYQIPHAIEIEENVIGVLIEYNNNETRDALTFLNEEDFYDNKLRNIFKIICELYASGKDIDLLIIIEELRAKTLLEECGGLYYISTIASKIINSNINTQTYILKQRTLQRKIIELFSSNMHKAYSKSEDVFDIIDKTMLELTKMDEYSSKADAVTSAQQVTNSFMSDMNSNEENNRFVWETGYPKFDEIVGVTRDKLGVLAGPAKGGKTKFNSSILFNLLERYDDVSIYWVTLEDSAKDIAAAYLSSKIFIKSKDIKRRMFSEESRHLIYKWMERFNSFDISFVEQSAKSWKIVNDFKNFCKVRKGRFCILIVDNILSLADREDFKGAENSMYDYVMAQFLSARQQTKAFIMLIHHFNDHQQDENKIKAAYRPRLKDMKGTETFRRTPNFVLLVNNPGKYDDLMAEYGEQAENLRNIFIVDTGANRDDKSDDDTALIRFMHTLDYNIFIEI